MKVILLVILLMVFPVAVCAKSLSVTIPVTSLDGEQEMTVSASPSGFLATDSLHIKGAFFTEGSSNYFGFTKSGDAWIKNSASTIGQKKVLLGDWDGQLVVKPDYSDSGFTESGRYFFKVGFYTIASDGDPSSVKWSNTVTIHLEKPVPTSTPIPTNTQKPTSLPTPTPTNAPTLIPTSAPTKVPPLKVTFSSTSSPKPTEIKEEVLGSDSEITPKSTATVTNTPTPFIEPHSPNYAIPFVFVGMGTGILAVVSGVSIIRKKGKEEDQIG